MDIIKMLEFAVDQVCIPFLLHTGIGVDEKLYLLTLTCMQYLKLMSVMKVPLDAIRRAQTHGLAMSVPATQAISWLVIDTDVKV